ncbi:MAG: hypothetical protein JXB39_14535 [Deltaproteobacteria bacterium]|nr:hypothetical protein [Deltaproteobacteria bacterium]
MRFRQCEAIIVYGRDEDGRRAGLVPPRRCRRVALEGSDYCEVHAPQAYLQDLLRRLFPLSWHVTVEVWMRDPRVREQLAKAKADREARRQARPVRGKARPR